MANAFPVTENFRLVLAHTPAGQKGIGAGIFNIANNLSMACGVCSFQIIYSLSSAFRPIFIFAGILYLLAFFASEAAEKAKGK
jgi:predicted MFS family arabinose efflux permease